MKQGIIALELTLAGLTPVTLNALIATELDYGFRATVFTGYIRYNFRYILPPFASLTSFNQMGTIPSRLLY